jgi:ABC-type transport system substrate-binding protein
MECLFCDNMLTDREEYNFRATWMPVEYIQGWMAESWNQTDPLTITVKLRQGVKWQDREPTNGREFTSDDVVFAFDRALGTGNGFTEPNPFFAPNMMSIDHVEAVDRYTFDVKLNAANPMAIYQVLEPSLRFGFTAPEWWALTDEQKQDFHYVVGTGAFILTDHVPNVSISFDRNTDYWGYDERHPDNQLPYLDHWKVLAIADMATQIAGLRTAKIDMIVDGRSHVSADQATSIKQTNPEIQVLYWEGGAGGVTFKYGSEHFSDIRVRKAMQMCVDTEAIAQGYYRGLGDPTPQGMAPASLGSDWSYPYDEWSAELQNEYKYNLTEAKKLMTEAGYPNGFKTNILFSTQDDVSIVQVLKDYFSKIGVDMEIDARDPITARMITNSLKYDQMVAGGGGGGGGSPAEGITGYWSKKLERAGGVDDPVYDAFVDEFYAATTLAECQRIYKEAAKYVAEQHWSVTLGTVKTPQVFQPWIRGWDGENFWSIPQWAYYARMWIDQSAKK